MARQGRAGLTSVSAIQWRLRTRYNCRFIFPRPLPISLPRGGHVSPILVRPVREQLEHDRVIRLLQVRLKRRHDVVDEHRRRPDGAGADRAGADFSGSRADLDRPRTQADGNGRGRNRRIRQSSRSDGPVGAPRAGARTVPFVRAGGIGRHRTSPGGREPGERRGNLELSHHRRSDPLHDGASATPTPEPRRVPAAKTARPAAELVATRDTAAPREDGAAESRTRSRQGPRPEDRVAQLRKGSSPAASRGSAATSAGTRTRLSCIRTARAAGVAASRAPGSFTGFARPRVFASDGRRSMRTPSGSSRNTIPTSSSTGPVSSKAQHDPPTETRPVQPERRDRQPPREIQPREAARAESRRRRGRGSRHIESTSPLSACAIDRSGESTAGGIPGRAGGEPAESRDSPRGRAVPEAEVHRRASWPSRACGNRRRLVRRRGRSRSVRSRPGWVRKGSRGSRPILRSAGANLRDGHRPGRRDQLKSQAERLNPDTWVTDAEVTAGLESYETVFESLRTGRWPPRGDAAGARRAGPRSADSQAGGASSRIRRAEAGNRPGGSTRWTFRSPGLTSSFIIKPCEPLISAGAEGVCGRRAPGGRRVASRAERAVNTAPPATAQQPSPDKPVIAPVNAGSGHPAELRHRLDRRDRPRQQGPVHRGSQEGRLRRLRRRRQAGRWCPSSSRTAGASTTTARRRRRRRWKASSCRPASRPTTRRDASG